MLFTQNISLSLALAQNGLMVDFANRIDQDLFINERNSYDTLPRILFAVGVDGEVLGVVVVKGTVVCVLK